MRPLAFLQLPCIALPAVLAACQSSGSVGPIDEADDGAGETDAAADESGDDGEDGSTGAAEEPDGPTFHADVLPILVEHCAGCHEPDGIGPFALEDYEQASALAEVIALQTAERIMPPFSADNSGACNTFADARWLDDEDIATLAAWADAGAPRGDASTPVPPRPEVPTLVADDIGELDTPAGYEPVPDEAGTNGLDDYQCFLVDPGVGDTTRFLTGYEVLPGNPAVTHHLVGFLVDLQAGGALGSNASVIETLDAASPDQPGWDCFGSAGNGVLAAGVPITWAPGLGAFSLPEGTGIAVPPGYAFVIQMHYNLANGGGEDSTRLRVAWADEVDREAINLVDDGFLREGIDAGVEIPPGEEAWAYQWDVALGALDPRIEQWGDVEILGILPHMHQIGQRMQIELVSGTDEQCGVFVPRWDFDWQQILIFEEPLAVQATDVLLTTCEWSSTSRSTPTLPGFGTQNEMCAIGVLVAQRG